MKFAYKILLLLLIISSCSTDSDNEEFSDCTLTPTLFTQQVSNVMETNAEFTGQITAPTCESTVTSQGFVYATTTLPKTDDFVIEVNGLEVSSQATGLDRNTTYFMRTFFVNPTGEYYGNEVQFTTQVGDINIATKSIDNVTTNSFESGGVIVDNGGGSILNKGVCYSTSPNPTISDTVIENNSENSSFDSQITDLNENTTYYMRAYATNASGTYYGNEEIVTTLSTEYKVELEVTGYTNGCGTQAEYFYYTINYRFDNNESLFDAAEGFNDTIFNHSEQGSLQENLELIIQIADFDSESPSDEFFGAYLDNISITITNLGNDQEVLNISLPSLFICTDTAYKNIINFNPGDNSYTIEQLTYGF